MTPMPTKPMAPRSKVPPVTPKQAGEEVGKMCAICSTPVSGGEMIVLCPHCKLPFHQDCWKEVGGCGTYGCPATPDVPKTETRPADDYQPGWSAEKTCPSCGKKIIATALKCKFCRAEFPIEKPMTSQEYLDREYTGEELLKIRNMVIANFIFSAVGCLFFLSIPANIFQLMTDSGMFRVVRLPPSLKVLFFSSLVISCLWGGIALLFIIF